jgi:Flp pilus assembly protein TadG
MRTGPDRAAAAGPVGPRFRRPHDDRGMATAEFVVVLPAIVLALLTGVGAVSAMTMRMRCADAAAVAARLAARGEPSDLVAAAARRAAPAGAHVRIDATATTVRVTVSVTARVLPVGELLPGFAVGGSFVEDREPGPPP